MAKKKLNKKVSLRPGVLTKKFDQKVANEVIGWLKLGEPLSAIYKKEGLPDRDTLRAWRATNEEFAEAVVEARNAIKDELPEDIVEEILERVTCGETLERICEDDHLPTAKTIYHWMNQNQAFREQYEATWTTSAETVYASLLDIEDRVLSGQLEPQAAAVLIKSIQWRLERRASAKFARLSRNELTGKDGGPIKTEGAGTITTDMLIQKLEEVRKTIGGKVGNADQE